MMALTTMGVAMIGYGIARAFRYYVKCQRNSLLEPPVDLAPGKCRQTSILREPKLSHNRKDFTIDFASIHIIFHSYSIFRHFR